MTETDRIVAWLRREAARLELYGDDHIDEAVRLDLAADAIERGDHLIRPEPTIPVSEWLPKSNLTYGDVG